MIAFPWRLSESQIKSDQVYLETDKLRVKQVEIK